MMIDPESKLDVVAYSAETSASSARNGCDVNPFLMAAPSENKRRLIQ